MNASQYNRHNPFMASVKERYRLSKPGSQKKTQHLVLDLRDSGIVYNVGDSIGVFSKHDPELVNKTLQALKMTGEEKVYFKNSEELIPIVNLLRTQVSITDVSPKLFNAVFARQPNKGKREEMESLRLEENRDLLKAYLKSREVWDFLFAHEEVSFTPQEFIALTMPLLPRFYSISSSQKYVGNEIHLTVAPFEYESFGHKRRGVCTHYLCELVDLHVAEVPIFVQPSHGFDLPEDPHIPMIMVGPGTGVAPFRAFLQERLLHHRSQGKHWLFFGEWNHAYDFFYEKDWDEFSKWGHLRLDLAFSRDQEKKVYVQHKMWEKGEELYHWLREGAYLYICGDAQRMAKDVESMLQEIIQQFGQQEPQEAKQYIKLLRQQKRYLRDVY